MKKHENIKNHQDFRIEYPQRFNAKDVLLASSRVVASSTWQIFRCFSLGRVVGAGSYPWGHSRTAMLLGVDGSLSLGQAKVHIWPLCFTIFHLIYFTHHSSWLYNLQIWIICRRYALINVDESWWIYIYIIIYIYINIPWMRQFVPRLWY